MFARDVDAQITRTNDSSSPADRRLRLRPPAAVPPAPATAVDPVCGMSVEIATARWTLERDGTTWYFCNPGCLEAFKSAAVGSD